MLFSMFTPILRWQPDSSRCEDRPGAIGLPARRPHAPAADYHQGRPRRRYPSALAPGRVTSRW